MIDDTGNNGSAGAGTQTNDILSQIDGKGNSYENDEISKNAGAKKDSSQGEQLFTPKELEAVYDVQIQISAVLGRSTMPVHQLLKLARGAVVELDRRVGEAIDIYVNNRLIARGEVVVVDDHLGVTMTEIIKSDRS